MSGEPRQGEGRRLRPPVRRRRTARTGGAFGIPGIARRGRTTLRQLFGLLAGSYTRWVADRREAGKRGLLFRTERVVAGILRLFVDRDLAALPFPEQLRRRLETLGPTYIKLGQILSLRRDILPRSVTDELTSLLSQLPPVPFEEIRVVVEEDLGVVLEEAFQAVDPVPLGSASIAQTHRAVTVEGDRVILKVVKPGIRELLWRDASLLKACGVVLQWAFARYQPRRIIDEFFEYTLREIEMTWEADNAETFAANFRDMPDIVFPRIYRHLSGEQVLCMEYLPGRQPDPMSLSELSSDERQQLLDLGAAAIIRMLYEDGFFHADLHPGNLMVLPGAKVGFVDLGMVGRLDPSLRTHLLFHFYCLIIEDYDNAARHLAAVAEHGPGSDVAGFRRAVKDLARRWRRATSVPDFSLALLILESIRLGARYRMYYPLEMVLMVKALVTYEGVGYMLDPEFNVAAVSQRHISRILRQHFNPLRLLREALRGAPEMVDALVRLPLLVSEGLDLMERQGRRQPENPFAGLRGTVLGAACLVSGAILAGLHAPWPLWTAMLLAGIFLGLRRAS